MFSLFFQCISCRDGISLRKDSASFPLCELCLESLVDAPPLCPSCWGPLCLQSTPSVCLAPWRKREHIQSYTARYLLIGRGYTVLKRWKIHSGHYFNQRILKDAPSALREIKPQAIIPIPQSLQRKWKMRGSRAEQIGEWLSREIQVPLLDILDMESRKIRQAEKKVLERMQSRIQFSLLKPVKHLDRVLLVDDFMTTGRTLHLAAQALYEAGIPEIHCFCLGLRLPRNSLLPAPEGSFGIGNKKTNF